MFVTIINDCKDANALGRQSARAASLLQAPVHAMGVEGGLDKSAELEAAGNLIDVLDASEGKPGVVLVNVAPRHGAAKKWPNGTPFGWFKHGETLVVSSVDGLVLSLVKKLGIAKEINVMDIPTVMDFVAEKGLLERDVAEYVKTTQFRSYEFIPRAAAWLVQGINLPAEVMPISEVDDAPAVVWWADNFGNCKTTLLADEASSISSDKFAGLKLYDRLKDLPNGETGLVIGSSGLPGKRFLEIMSQGESAAKKYSLQAGTLLS